LNVVDEAEYAEEATEGITAEVEFFVLPRGGES
jgi:hypothetical protein